jgi:hypothetical protein
MKTVCFGRYLLDVPRKAEFALGFAKSDAIRIESVAPRSTDAEFREKLAAREIELRALRHDTEGTRLRGVSELPGNRGRMFLYREDAGDRRMTIVEALVRHDSAEWLLRFQASDRDVSDVKRDMEEVAASLSVRAMTDIPVDPGVCIRDSFLMRSPHEVEEFAGGAKVEELSWSLSLRSETSKPYKQSEQMLTRMADSIGMAGGFASGIKVLRKREIMLDGRKGQEHVALFPGEHVVSFDARLELYGDGTYKVPTLKVEMEANRLAPPDSKDKRVFLSDDEALEVWDLVLRNIRPRTGAF